MKKLNLKEIKEIINNEKKGLTVQFKNSSLKEYNSHIKQIENYKKELNV